MKINPSCSSYSCFAMSSPLSSASAPSLLAALLLAVLMKLSVFLYLDHLELPASTTSSLPGSPSPIPAVVTYLNPEYNKMIIHLLDRLFINLYLAASNYPFRHDKNNKTDSTFFNIKCFYLILLIIHIYKVKHKTLTILMLHKQNNFIYLGSKNEVILSKICGKYEFK